MAIAMLLLLEIMVTLWGLKLKALGIVRQSTTVGRLVITERIAMGYRQTIQPKWIRARVEEAINNEFLS